MLGNCTIDNAVSFLNTGNLTLGDAVGDVFTFSGGMTSIGAGTNTFQGTVATDGGAGHDVNVDDLSVGANGLILNTAGSGNLNFTGTMTVSAADLSVAADQVIAPAGTISVAVARTATIAASADITLGTASIAGANTNAATASDTGALMNGRLDVGDSSFTIATLANDGIFRLTGNSGVTHTITNVYTTSGIIEYYGAGGTVYSDLRAGLTDYYHLRINGTAFADKFELNGVIGVAGDVIIDGGVLDVSPANHQISVAGNWRNTVPEASYIAFDARQGTVDFSLSTAALVENLGLTVRIYGDNYWWIFYCHVNGATILFENNRTQHILAISGLIYGLFDVRAGSWPQSIVLNRMTSGADPTIPTPLQPGDDGLFWFFDLMPNAKLEMAFVDVHYSNARSNPVNIPGDVHAGYQSPYPYFNFKWLSKLYAIYSYTEDGDYDGKIDRIRVTTETGVGQFRSAPWTQDFGGFDVQVEGYEIDRSKGDYNGFELPPTSSKTLYIHLVEKPYLDSGVIPRWRVLRNTTLKDSGGTGKLFGTLEYVSAGMNIDWMTPGDTSWPRIGYTLAVPRHPEQFIHLSEGVVTAGGITPSGPDLGLTGPATWSSGSAPSVEEAVGPGPAHTSAQLAAGLTDMTLTGTLKDLGTAPAWHVPFYDALVSGPDMPRYPPSNGYVGDPDSWVMALSNGTIDRPDFELQRGGAEPNTHRVSDVLVSLPPTAPIVPAIAEPFFIWPVWAKNDSYIGLPSGTDLWTPGQAESLTIGFIRAFDGTQWLRDQDFSLQALNGPVVGGPFTDFGIPSIVYDSNVASLLVGSASGTWLPTHGEVDFSGMDGYPDTAVSTKAALEGALPGNGLWNWKFSASDPKVFSVAKFDFFFHMASSPADLYVGRLSIPTTATAIPANWYRLVRPFSFDVHDIKAQKGGVTVLNNVIDPTKGERVRLNYTVDKEGPVTVTVFTLDGDVVTYLYKGKRSPGDYTENWNGRNNSGAVVARGIYFIRVVGPGFDEIRKVMVVK
ncbi:MAG: hypothetical protein NT080_05140 [Spirochaetes bacterium]|nr:hypothetical protein [Spirochaetota bacterium]